jgi:Ankyrin repeats (3 copies)
MNIFTQDAQIFSNAPQAGCLINSQWSDVIRVRELAIGIEKKVESALEGIKSQQKEFLENKRKIEEIALACETEADWKLLPFVELIRASGNVNEKDKNQTTILIEACCLHSAYWNGFPNLVKLLLSHPRILVNEKDRMETTALMWAAFYGFDEVIGLLINDLGIDLLVNNQWQKAIDHLKSPETKSLIEAKMHEQWIDICI